MEVEERRTDGGAPAGVVGCDPVEVDPVRRNRQGRGMTRVGREGEVGISNKNEMSRIGLDVSKKVEMMGEGGYGAFAREPSCAQTVGRGRGLEK